MLQRSVSIEIEDLDGSGDDSNDVCNFEGSTCPENICCRQELCDKEGNGVRCCEDPDTDPVGCANCPKCGELTYKTQITKLTQFIFPNCNRDYEYTFLLFSVDCSWTSWTECKENTKTKKFHRTRKITKEAKFGGKECEGRSKQECGK